MGRALEAGPISFAKSALPLSDGTGNSVPLDKGTVDSKNEIAIEEDGKFDAERRV